MLVPVGAATDGVAASTATTTAAAVPAATRR